MISREDFHQRGFPSTIFAENANDAAFAKCHADIFVRVDGPELFFDVLQSDLHRVLAEPMWKKQKGRKACSRPFRNVRNY